MRYTTALFDLDGTLTDPGEGITRSVAYALERYGITVGDRRELYGFIGPPLADSFMTYYGFSRERAAEAVEVYREYFSDRGIFENDVYPGVPEMLEKLRSSGVRLAVATSKPEQFADTILEHFGLSGFFEAVGGASMDETRVSKHDVIERALSMLGSAGRAGTVMVGDRSYDISGAKSTGIASVGVLYGYGGREELEAAGADRLAETPEDVAKIILG